MFQRLASCIFGGTQAKCQFKPLCLKKQEDIQGSHRGTLKQAQASARPLGGCMGQTHKSGAVLRAVFKAGIGFWGFFVTLVICEGLCHTWDLRFRKPFHQELPEANQACMECWGSLGEVCEDPQYDLTGTQPGQTRLNQIG